MATKKKGIKLKISFSCGVFIQHIFNALEGVVSWVVETSEFFYFQDENNDTSSIKISRIAETLFWSQTTRSLWRNSLVVWWLFVGNVKNLNKRIFCTSKKKPKRFLKSIKVTSFGQRQIIYYQNKVFWKILWFLKIKKKSSFEK